MKGISRLLAATILAGSCFAASAGGPPAGVAQQGKPDGVECLQAGLQTLRSLGLLSAVAAEGIAVVDVGTLDLKTVLELHRTNPELFDGSASAVTVVVPGVGPVVASWCE